MTAQHFALLGHSSPLGKYPAPVVPVGLLNEKVVAVYSGVDTADVVPVADDCSYVVYDSDRRGKFADFDYRRHRLFALNEEEIMSYLIEREGDFFSSLLGDSEFARGNPFLRLSLAKATGQVSLIANELPPCAHAIVSRVPHYLDIWINEEKQSVVEEIRTEDVASLLKLLESLYMIAPVASAGTATVPRTRRWLAGLELFVSQVAQWVPQPMQPTFARGQDRRPVRRYELLIPELLAGPAVLEVTLDVRPGDINVKVVIVKAPENEIRVGIAPEFDDLPEMVKVRAGWSHEESFPKDVRSLILCISHLQATQTTQNIYVPLPGL